MGQRMKDFAQRKTIAIANVRRTGNVGGRLPAMIECASENLQSEVLMLTNAWKLASKAQGVSSEVWVEDVLSSATI